MLSQMQRLLQTETLGRSAAYYIGIDSTSTYLKDRWHLLDDGFTVIAAEQTAGRGRTGKTFFSPKNDGLYFSFVLKDKRYRNDPLFTVKMSYAVCAAIDRLTDTMDVSIKWVNDIYIDHRKLAGILCEAVKKGSQSAILVGVGVNFVVDKALVPSELRHKIGSLHNVSKKKMDKATLCAYVLNEVERLYFGTPEAPPLSAEEFLAAYRRRSAVLGREILVMKQEKALRAAALDIASDGGLIVRYETGVSEKLTAGEISIVLS